MELRQLKYFIAVADTLNFSRAAETLYVSQPTLSQQIAELEEELGISLFIRTKRTVLLTPEGAKLLDKAKTLLHQSEQMLNYIHNLSTEETSNYSLCIGYEKNLTNDDNIFQKIAHATLHMREKHPTLRLFFREVPREDQKRALRQNEIDILLTSQQDTDLGEDVNCIEIAKDYMELVTYSSSPIQNTLESVQTIFSSKTVFFRKEDSSEGIGHMLSLFEELHVKPRIQFIDSSESIKLLLMSGDGCIIIPHAFHTEFQSDTANFLDLSLPDNCIFTSLAWYKKNLNPMIQIFIQEYEDLADFY